MDKEENSKEEFCTACVAGPLAAAAGTGASSSSKKWIFWVLFVIGLVGLGWAIYSLMYCKECNAK